MLKCSVKFSRWAYSIGRNSNDFLQIYTQVLWSSYPDSRLHPSRNRHGISGGEPRCGHPLSHGSQGIRTQTQVRYKLIAAAKAQEVINLLRQNQPGLGFDARDQDKEGVFPWDTRTTYKAMAPDLEPMLESVRGTIKPLPEVIARRLVSDDDEIRTLINNGGRLYYFYPGLPAQGVESPRSSPMDINWIDGSRKLVMGVVGVPQQNSIFITHR